MWSFCNAEIVEQFNCSVIVFGHVTKNLNMPMQDVKINKLKFGWKLIRNQFVELMNYLGD